MPKRRRAYRQGDFDGLCGVYAIVNALRCVLHLQDEQCQRLFAKLIKALEKDCDHLYQPVLHGMYFGQLKRLVGAAGRGHIQGRNLTFHVQSLRLKRNQRSLSCLWDALNRRVGHTCVAIIGVNGATDHWCVVYRVTPRTLWLLDSSGQSRIHRSRCTVRLTTTRYCLDSNEILLIERHP
ncbi:hypothetical protein IC232_13815 [Microvirga sp. BT688]|uniref:hypothetical protein n=1 Tax=Microvirga sp. TaxID=1873136 RepID=UPI0016833568|nr:hypothetical protein [Microvirga sp.]MBD2747776.1 hypothetical protein [Microvirga sp.]